MTELQIGQSLTYEQVMALPDGAMINGVYCACPPDTLIRIGGRWQYASGGGCGITYKENWGSEMWMSATLVSLPSQGEPSPSQGVDYGSGDTTVITVSTSAPVAEIEKEAALALIDARAKEVLRWAERYEKSNDSDSRNILVDECRKLVESEVYARSIGAIE
jgi:hypothetical protein